MVKEHDFAAGASEFLKEQDLVGIFAGQTIRAVDRQYVNSGITNTIPQVVEGGAIEPGTTIAFVAEDVLVG
jgi:hypothetical protein